MTDYMELNKLTDLIDHIDSEMTRIYNKLLEFEYLIEEFTDSEDERFAATLNNRRRSYMREYNLLSIDLGKLVEKRREILDQKVNDLTKKEEKRMVSKEQLSHEELFMLSPMERDILERGGKIQLQFKRFENI